MRSGTPSFYQSIQYFRKLFPPIRIQKPGYDLYGLSTMILSITLFWVYWYDDKMTVNENMVIPDAKEVNGMVFKASMAITLFCVAVIMIFERYISRSDVSFIPKEENLDLKSSDGFFKDEIFRGEEDITQQTIRF
jgi:hypothetical protein